ncbi:MAG: calcium/sodium antiporter [Bacteroidales bacterium]|nr:calcium/sodium antiporter [Bacteroidales bacterium]HPD95097.1 calcium/sodium antiporter [Tenuifilaceae bacterium]HRX31543.1 calcium/sodium antiporter [Tenuifilaceae bacterium]
MLLKFLIIAVGLVALVYGATWLVEGASSIAKKLGVSALTIGLTVVAFGTSAPELAVNVISATTGNSEIALGNILGSNIFNVFVILGISALIKPIIVQRKTVKIEIPFNFLATAVVFALAGDMFIDHNSSAFISRSDAIILLLLFAVFLYYNFLSAKMGDIDTEPDVKKRNAWYSVLMIVGGLVLLVAGGRIIVYSAVKIAEALGVSQAVIGLTIVAAGTSLPELATSAIAAYRGKSDIAIGNVVGSNIFNLLLVLGVTSFIRPINIYPNAWFDLSVNILGAILMLVFAMWGRKCRISRVHGAIFLAIAIAYNVYLVINA